MLLFLQVNLNAAFGKEDQESKLKFLEALITCCKKHNYDGIVLQQDFFNPEQNEHLRKARSLAPEMVIIS